MPEVINDNLLTNVDILEAGQIDISGATGWQLVNSGWPYPNYLSSNTPGSEFTKNFTGTDIGLHWKSDSDKGNIEYSVDGNVYQTASPYNSPNTPVMLAEGLTNTNHTVKINSIKYKK